VTDPVRSILKLCPRQDPYASGGRAQLVSKRPDLESAPLCHYNRIISHQACQSLRASYELHQQMLIPFANSLIVNIPGSRRSTCFPFTIRFWKTTSFMT
jgi:hypothetical protein